MKPGDQVKIKETGPKFWRGKVGTLYKEQFNGAWLIQFPEDAYHLIWLYEHEIEPLTEESEAD